MSYWSERATNQQAAGGGEGADRGRRRAHGAGGVRLWWRRAGVQVLKSLAARFPRQGDVGPEGRMRGAARYPGRWPWSEHASAAHRAGRGSAVPGPRHTRAPRFTAVAGLARKWRGFSVRIHRWGPSTPTGGQSSTRDRQADGSRPKPGQAPGRRARTAADRGHNAQGCCVWPRGPSASVSRVCEYSLGCRASPSGGKSA